MSNPGKLVYVQITIRGSMDRVWELTQVPGLHRQWDLRFTDIEYLPRPDESQPQRFLYATRIGMGLDIRGTGETIGTRDDASGQRTSALKFWSADWKSLIREGSGYWKYSPIGGGVQFVTGYQYDVRFGPAGRVFDRRLFRPLMGWATAWSFDRLRLWVERGVDPGMSMRRSVVQTVARTTAASVWIYQGVVPKLIARHPDELLMIRQTGFPASAANAACAGIGIAEVLLGLVLLIAWHTRWPLWFTIVAMPAALIAVAVTSPAFVSARFNPVTLNISLVGLAAIALINERDLPSARRCLRRPPSEQT
jgi:uncharacterized membrane protein YphA (DoxX/SURF4 family)